MWLVGNAHALVSRLLQVSVQAQKPARARASPAWVGLTLQPSQVNPQALPYSMAQLEAVFVEVGLSLFPKAHTFEPELTWDLGSGTWWYQRPD